VVEQLVRAYALDRADIEAAVEDFVAELEREQLIVQAGEEDSRGPTVDAELPPEYTAPKLSIYSDMKDMLLLDPVHDVADVGWPTRPE
jgi:hypothetical protein